MHYRAHSTKVKCFRWYLNAHRSVRDLCRQSAIRLALAVIRSPPTTSLIRAALVLLGCVRVTAQCALRPAMTDRDADKKIAIDSHHADYWHRHAIFHTRLESHSLTALMACSSSSPCSDERCTERRGELSSASRKSSSEESSGIGQKVAEHVGRQIPPPDIQQSKNDSSPSDYNQVYRSPSAKMGISEGRDRHDHGQNGAPGELPNLFDEIATKEDFLSDSRSQHQQKSVLPVTRDKVEDR